MDATLHNYLLRGVPVFPVNPQTKKPLTENGFYAATKDPDIINLWIKKHTNLGWAMPTGERSGVLGIDLDRKNGKDGVAAWGKLVDGRDVPETVEYKTPHNGIQLWFNMPRGVDIRSGSDVLGEGIDIRGNGGYACVPPTPGYEFIHHPDDYDVADAPDWLVEMLTARRNVKPADHKTGMHRVTPDMLRAKAALDKLDPDDYDLWVKVGMAGKASYGENWFPIWKKWSSGSEKFKEGECETKWDSFKRDGLTAGSLFYWTSDGDDDCLLVDDDEYELPFKIHDMAEALVPQPEIDWLVRGLISRRSVSLVVGPPGCYKTYAMLSLAMRAALGLPWLDFQTEKCKILLIDEESGQRRLNRRLHEVYLGEIGSKKGMPDIKYTSLAQFDLNDPDWVSNLYVTIKRTQADLVIIDALVDVMPGGDENAVKDVQPIFKALRKISEETNSGIIVIHHTNKNGGYRGSSAMSGAVDLMLTVRVDKEDKFKICFESEKARDIEHVEFAAEVVFNDGATYLTDRGFTQKERKDSRSKQYVIRFLSEHGPSTVEDIMDGADTCSPAAAKLALYAIAEDGRIKRVDTGPAKGKGNKATYAIVGTHRL